jgi:hypothetical protein
MQEHAHKSTQNSHSLFTLRFSFKVLQAQFGVSHAVFQMLILTSRVCIASDPDRQISNLGSAMPTETLCGPIATELAALPAQNRHPLICLMLQCGFPD